MQQLRAMFFDIGGTLGDVDVPTLTLELFPTTQGVLSAVQALGLELGIISNVPAGVDRQRISLMLKQAGILAFFRAQGIVTSTDAGSAKPSKGIYPFAVRRKGHGTPARGLRVRR